MKFAMLMDKYQIVRYKSGKRKAQRWFVFNMENKSKQGPMKFTDAMAECGRGR